jgi:signal transduction histidine kinase/PAS domain-containing protein
MGGLGRPVRQAEWPARLASVSGGTYRVRVSIDQRQDVSARPADRLADENLRLQELARQARERAEEEHLRLESLIMQAPALICVLRGPEHRIELANSRFAQLAGGRDLRGKTLREALPQLEAQGLIERLDRVYATGEPYAREAMPVRIERPGDGSAEEAFFDFVYQPLRGRGGAIEGVLGHGVDVTGKVRARRRSEELSNDLRRTEALFRASHESSPIAFSYLRIVREGADVVDLEYVYQNEAASRINRLPAGAGCAGVRLLAAFPGLGPTPIWASYRRVAATGEAWQDELHYDGEHFDGWYRITGTRPTEDTLVLTFEDTTRVRRAEEERREQASINEALLRIGRALTALDLHELVQRVTDEATAACHAQFGAFFYNVTNQQGESYTLYATSGVPREAFERFPMPRNTAIFAPTFNGERIVRYDDVTTEAAFGRNAPHHGMPRGHLPVRSYLAAPVVTRSGEVLGGLFFGHADPGVFKPRDERILAAIAPQAAIAMDNARLFELARRERRSAEIANRAKDEFLATISHELRTPLTAILGWTRMLRAGTLAEPKRARALEIIERNANAQVTLIEDVLDVSRIITGKMRLDVAPVDLGQVVQAAVETVRPAALAREVGLDVRLDPDVGTVVGDGGRLQQIVWNLLSNAVKFTPKGGRVRVRLARRDTHVEILVADTGMGVAREFLPFVFDRFRQEDSAITRSHGGLGLGLAIVKHLTELHGGTVTAESDGPGAGATFTVRLPVGPRPERSP